MRGSILKVALAFLTIMPFVVPCVFAGRFDFLNNSKLGNDKKLAKLRFLSEKRVTDIVDVTGVTQEELSLLKKQFITCDSILVIPIYGFISQKLSASEKEKLISTRLGTEKDFETRDWLIAELLLTIRSAKLQDNPSRSLSLYSRIMDILKNSSSEYRNHYIENNADLLFSEALIGNKLEDLSQYAYHILNSSDDPGDLKMCLALVSAIAKQIPLDNLIVKALKDKLSINTLKDYHKKIRKILNVKSPSNAFQYPELKHKEIGSLLEILANRKNPASMRIEALYSITAKCKWRLFSAQDGDKNARKALLTVIRDREDDSSLKNEILLRMVMERQTLKTEAELKSNCKLIHDTLELLHKQKEHTLEKNFILKFPPSLLKLKMINTILQKHLQDDSSDMDLKSAIVFAFSQLGIKTPIDVLAETCKILKNQSSLSSDSKRLLIGALHLAYKDKLQSKIDALNADDKKLLMKLE